MKRYIVAILLLICCTRNLLASECPSLAPVDGQRYLVAISDLHLGVGKVNGKWHPTEDFRWSSALLGFLQRISKCGNDSVDLVVAGDALELWQPPPEVKCKGADENTGCTPEEFLTLTDIVIKAHKNDFSAFGAFSDRGTNRVFFLPGNHDAALLLDKPWQHVLKALNSNSKRVFLCGKNSVRPCTNDGIWASDDGGLIVIEHGHQIGSDVNKFKNWPNILVVKDGAQYVERPWGQAFVQALFNAEEMTYPIIDNLIPESAGARYRMADRKIWSSAVDVARFLRFSLFQTSLSQRADLLGAGTTPSSEWDYKKARELGNRLFSHALADGDPFRATLEGHNEQSEALRKELDRELKSEKEIPDVEVKFLCEQMQILRGETCDGTLGYTAETLLVSKYDVIAAHLSERKKDQRFNGMRIFIYAHTHELEEEWTVSTDDGTDVLVYNTGAFQRLVDDSGFRRRAAIRHMELGEALRMLKNEDLPPCYTAVVVALGATPIVGQTVRWNMEESGAGQFVMPGDPSCD